MSDVYSESCERCSASSPLRSIMMMGGGREVLCEDCFKSALDDDEVHPADPRIETRPGDYR